MSKLISAHTKIKPLFLLSALSDQLSLHQAKGKLPPPSLLLRLAGEERRPRRVTRGSQKWNVPLLSSSLRPLRSGYLHSDFWEMGRPVTQKWIRVTPHSDHNSGVHGARNARSRLPVGKGQRMPVMMGAGEDDKKNEFITWPPPPARSLTHTHTEFNW